MPGLIELVPLLLAALGILAIKGVRFGAFYVLLTLVFAVPLGMFFFTRTHYPLEPFRAQVWLVLTGAGLVVFVWVLWKLRQAGRPRNSSPPRTHDDSSTPQATLSGRGWLYRAFRIHQPVPCTVEYRFVWNHDPLSPVFGEEMILVNGQMVQQRLVQNWFGQEYEFELPRNLGSQTVRLRLRFRWPTLHISAVQLKVNDTVVYEENPEYWTREKDSQESASLSESP